MRVLALLLATTCGTPAAPPPNASPTLRYRLDATDPSRDHLLASLTLRNLPPSELALIPGKPPALVRFEDVTATGAELVRRGTDSDPVFVLRITGATREVTVRWHARPVEESQHGRVGFFGGSFAVLHGGMLLLPRDELAREAHNRSGRAQITDVRVSVLAPPSAQVATSLTERDGMFDPSVRDRWRYHHLRLANFAIGRFAQVEERIGAMTHRVYVPEEWAPSKRQQVTDRVFRIHRAYDAQLRCESAPRYTTIFVPPRPDGGMVAGEFWSTGQLFAFDAYPDDPRRPYELLAHRIAHGANKYEICGMRIESAKERWFIEGWASWSEVTHLLAANVTRDEERLNVLGNRYRNVHLGIDLRTTDVPVWFEARPGRAPTIDYLHYTKAPLVVMMLDYELRRRSGGRKHVNDFLHRIYPRYRGGVRTLPLFDELAAYLGASLEDFETQYVTEVGSLFPVFPGAAAYFRAELANRGPIAIEHAGQTMPRAQLDGLRELFELARLEPVGETEARAREMLATHAEYLTSGRDSIPADVLESVTVLPASVRYQLFREERRRLAIDAPPNTGRSPETP